MFFSGDILRIRWKKALEEIRHRIILEHCEKSDNDMMKENKKDGTIAVWKHKYTKKIDKNDYKMSLLLFGIFSSDEYNLINFVRFRKADMNSF